MKDKNYYLNPKQWNFGGCPSDWLEHCYHYEYAREVKWIRDYYNYWFEHKTKNGITDCGSSYFTDKGWFYCLVEDERLEQAPVEFWLAPGFPDKSFMELDLVKLGKPVERELEGHQITVREIHNDKDLIDHKGLSMFLEKNNASLKMKDPELVALFQDWIKGRRKSTGSQPRGLRKPGHRVTDGLGKALRALGAMRLLRETSSYRALRFTKTESGHPLYPKSERFTQGEVLSYEILRQRFAASKEDLSEASQVRSEHFF